MQGKFTQTNLEEVASQFQVRGIACLSQDKHLLAVGYSDKKVRFFDLEKKTKISEANTPAGVLCIQLDLERYTLVCGIFFYKLQLNLCRMCKWNCGTVDSL